MADFDDDRPHYHTYFDGTDDCIAIDHDCIDDDCTRDNPLIVIHLNEYRTLVAAARDRHPTNQRGGTDPAGRAIHLTEPPNSDSRIAT